MENQSGIYEIFNRLDGKRYIGQAKKFKARWARHVSKLKNGEHHSPHLQHAWDRYGADAFKLRIILTCAPTREMLCFYEQQLLDKVKPEYNVSPTAGTTLGVPCSDNTKKKMSKAHRGRTLTPEHRAAIAAAGVGRIPSETARANMRAAQQAVVAADPVAFSQRCAKIQRNRVWTAEARAKLSAARAGKSYPKSPEGRERQRQAVIAYNKTRVISDSTREKLAALKRGTKMSPKALALQSERMRGNSYRKGVPWTPEMRVKILAARAATYEARKHGALQ